MYNLYLSDDALPVLKEGLLRMEDIVGHSALQHILADGNFEWPESPVKELIEKAIASGKWRVQAARNPEIFIQEFDRSLDRPDVLVFDWDYPGIKDPEKYLREFLSRTYCIVQIYSGADMKKQIEDVIDSEPLAPYRSRIFLAEKSEVAPDELLKMVTKSYKDNFSYCFGTDLRSAALKSLEQILVSLGRNSIDEVMSLLHAAGTTETDFKELLVEKLRSHLRENEEIIKNAKELGVSTEQAQTLLDLIAEKLRDDLNSEELKLMIAGSGVGVDEKTREAATKLWSYRLYYKPSDSCVRRGDFLQRKGTEEKYIIVSADCDLNRLWQKNYGYVNLIPAYEVGKTSKALADRLELSKITPANLDWRGISSIIKTPRSLSDGTLLLPFVPLKKGFFDFLLFPKEILSVRVSVPAAANGNIGIIRSTSLNYELFKDYDRICTLSEPFLSPFVTTLLTALAGQGVPDYPPIVQDTIHGRNKAALN